MIIDSKYFKGTHRNINKTSIKKKLIRIIISIFIIIPIFVLPVNFISSIKYSLVVLMVRYGIPSFFIGLLMFGYSKKFYERFNLVKKEDLSIECTTPLSLISESEDD